MPARLDHHRFTRSLRRDPATAGFFAASAGQMGGRPIADPDRIDWYERETVIVPDSDVWTRPDLLQPVFALGKELEQRG